MWNLKQRKKKLNSRKQGAGNSGGEMGSVAPCWSRIQRPCQNIKSSVVKHGDYNSRVTCLKIAKSRIHFLIHKKTITM